MTTVDYNTLSLDELFDQLIDHAQLDDLIDQALAEDLDEAGDITTQAMIEPDRDASAILRTRAAGVLAGGQLIVRVASRYDAALAVTDVLADGTRMAPEEVAARVEGPLFSVLAVERVLLNFVSHLSGIATLTAKFVDAVAGTGAAILDTRKTLPGWRRLAKYAVRCGGGRCHRIGLFDAVLIKDNHLAHLDRERLADALAAAIRQTRDRQPPPSFVEVEVDNLDQFRTVLDCAVDVILLDNLGPNDLRRAVALRDERNRNVKLEASGGVTLDSVRDLAETGVDRISIGALTHSAAALDLGLDVETT